MEKTVSTFLKQAGLLSTYIGYRYIKYAIMLVVEDESYLFAATKRLYPAIAEYFNTTPSAVEHNMRTLLETYWNQYGGKRLEEITGFPVAYKPTTREFIAFAADYINQL